MDYPISEEALEAAARTLVDNGFVEREIQDDDRVEARCAINAFLAAEGFEEQVSMRGGEYEAKRLVSPWRPSEGQ